MGMATKNKVCYSISLFLFQLTCLLLSILLFVYMLHIRNIMTIFLISQHNIWYNFQYFLLQLSLHSLSLIFSLKLKLGVDNTFDGTAHVTNCMQGRYNCAKYFKEGRETIRYQLPQPKTCHFCNACLFHRETFSMCCKDGKISLPKIFWYMYYFFEPKPKSLINKKYLGKNL